VFFRGHLKHSITLTPQQTHIFLEGPGVVENPTPKSVSRIAFATVTTEATALAILLVGLAGCIVEMLDRGY
jgi:hypothetical protein